MNGNGRTHKTTRAHAHIQKGHPFDAKKRSKKNCERGVNKHRAGGRLAKKDGRRCRTQKTDKPKVHKGKERGRARNAPSPTNNRRRGFVMQACHVKLASQQRAHLRSSMPCAPARPPPRNLPTKKTRDKMLHIGRYGLQDLRFT